MEILKEIENTVQSVLPSETQITKIEMEGPEVAIYTRNPKAFFENESFVAKVAFELKKRVHIRTDKSLLTEPEEAKKKILEIVPENAGIQEIYFSPAFSEVVIESMKPGVVIGKGGEISKRITLETGWTPTILRSPTSPSEILKGIRHHLFKNSAERKKTLQEVAKKIYRKIEPKADSWIRLTALGSFQEVGRSCILLETPHSKILLDCGINPAGNENAYPYLDSLNFPLTDLDAIIISHAHTDHAGFLPYLFRMGYQGPVYCTAPTRDLMTLLQFDFIDVSVKEGKEPLYAEKDVKEMLKYCITREYREVTDIAPDVRMTFHNAAHILGSASVHLHIGSGQHNFVYSLDSKTPVTVFDENNNIQIIEIGKLVDREIKKYGVKEGIVDEAKNKSGWKTIAFNPQTLKAEMVEITSFIRHPITEDLFEITTKTGRKTTVTASHSVFTVKNGEVQSIRATDLKLGDSLVASKRILLEPKDIPIKLPPKKFALQWSGKALEQQLKTIEKKAKKHFPEKLETVMQWTRDYLENGLFKKDIAKKYRVSQSRMVRLVFQKLGIPENPRVKNSLPHEIRITPDFARFLGYFISEGSFNGNIVIVTQSTREMLEDCLKIIQKEFGITGKIVKNDAHFYSKQLMLLLRTVLKTGKGAYHKRMPPQLALGSVEVIGQFLKGCFMGDGSIRKRKKGKGISINYASQSRLLVQDIAFLLLRLGITPTFEYNRTSKMHNLHVYGRDQLTVFFEHIKIGKWEQTVLSQPAQKPKSHFASRIPIQALSEQTQEVLSRGPWQNTKSCGTAMLLKIGICTAEKKLIESDLVFDEIKSIRKTRPTNKFVYDLSVNGYENFLGGWGQLFLHNSADIKYGFTRLFNNIDLNYPRLETLLIESTYARKDDIQPDRQTSEMKLVQIVKETIQQGGNVLFPVFAVGRAQEIMLTLEDAYRRGLLEGAKVYIDGMTKEASAIHTAYPEYLRRGVQRRILQNDSPFTGEMFNLVKQGERDEILAQGGNIVLASSGMLTGGASLQYFYKMAEDPRNTLIFVGYQGEGSLGRKLQNNVKEIPITDENGRTKGLKINLRIENVEAFSVPYETDLLVKKNGEFELTQIGKIADEHLPPNAEGIAELKGVLVPSFDENGKIELKAAQYIIKHKTTAPHLQIKTKSGRSVQASKGHSVFVLQKGEIKTVQTGELKKGDYLVIPKTLPESHTLTQVSIADFVSNPNYKTIGAVFKPEKGGNNKSFLKTHCRDMKSLARFLGYYIAEGHIHYGKCDKPTLSFSHKEKDTLVADATDCIQKAFGLTPSFRSPHPTEIQIEINNSLLAEFMENIGVGKGAKNKRVPSLVFNLSPENQKEFLYAYFAGDGYDYKNGSKGYLAAKTASKQLASDLSYLLLQQGIPARIKGPFIEKERKLNGQTIKESIAYKIYCAEKDFKRAIHPIGYTPFALPIHEICLKELLPLIQDTKQRKRAREYVNNYQTKDRKLVGLEVLRQIFAEEKTVNHPAFKTIQKFLLGNLGVDEIAEIKEAGKPSFEYDLSVPGAENFVGGYGGICLHNSGHSDHPQLVNYIRNLKPKPKLILTNHGNKVKTIEFAKFITQKFHIPAQAPHNLDSIRLK